MHTSQFWWLKVQNTLKTHVKSPCTILIKKEKRERNSEEEEEEENEEEEESTSPALDGGPICAKLHR